MSRPVALVTGAGSGIGRAIAVRLASDGYEVVVNDLDADAAGATAELVSGSASVFDVADGPAVDAAFDTVVAEHRRLDIVVNNAGIAPNRPELQQRALDQLAAAMGGVDPEPLDALVDLDDASWDRMIRTHLYGVFHGTRAALRTMTPARSGSIVNMASLLGVLSAATAPAYAAAKAGIISLTKSTASEVAPLGIRVNAVAPGWIDTPLIEALGPQITDMLVTVRIPTRRLGTPEEIAGAVAFLVGPDGHYCNGEILTMSGGYGLS